MPLHSAFIAPRFISSTLLPATTYSSSNCISSGYSIISAVITGKLIYMSVLCNVTWLLPVNVSHGCYLSLCHMVAICHFATWLLYVTVSHGCYLSLCHLATTFHCVTWLLSVTVLLYLTMSHGCYLSLCHIAAVTVSHGYYLSLCHMASICHTAAIFNCHMAAICHCVT